MALATPKVKGNSTGNGRGGGGPRARKCFYCKETGHIKKDCPKWLAKKRETAAVTEEISLINLEVVDCDLMTKTHGICSAVSEEISLINLEVVDNHLKAKTQGTCFPVGKSWASICSEESEEDSLFDFGGQTMMRMKRIPSLMVM